MANIKVRDLTDTSSITTDNQIMVLTNDSANQVQNITVGNLLTNVLSADNGNVLEQGTDGKLYVETPENITGNLSDLATVNKTSLVNSINEVVSNLSTEATTRANADNNLQSQIDAITAASDVTDIVGTYAELQAYDTTGLPDKSIIKVLQDESRQGETTYYRWVITGGVGSWVLIGEEGPYYTISQADSKFATQETVGNLSNLATSDKSSVVNAMNELASVLDPTQTADYIKNSKAIYSGEVSENALILPQIKEMAHSTFDFSKFAVVGTPTITSDGIVTNLTTNNFLYKTLTTGAYSNLEVGFNFVYNNQGYIAKTAGFGNFYQVYLGSNAVAFDILTDEGGSQVVKTISINNVTLTTGIEYSAKIKINNLNLTCSVTNLSTDVEKKQSITLSETFVIQGGFKNALALYNVASADYKKAYINIENKPYFNGNKTGIDTIKPANYDIVGTPTITDDGIVSGFTNSDFITIPKTVIDSLIGHSWEIEIPVENIPVGTIDVSVLGAFDFGANNIILGRGNTGTGLFLNIVNGTSNIVGGDTYVTLNATDKGTCYVGFDGSKYYIKLVLSTGTVRTDEYETTTEFTSKSSGLKLYYRCSDCSLDANKVKVRRDGNLIYQACLKIPYTEGFNGEKIVNVAYRGRVQDAYNQGFTNALYFTLDEANGNFTLPQGELYGMITRNQQEIGLPVPTLSNNLKSNEIWLEGASVLKSVYPQLYAIYGDAYEDAENPTDSDHFRLPNCVGRIMQGIDGTGTFGYLAAGLPNITGAVALTGVEGVAASGAFAVGSSRYGRNIGHENATEINQFTLDASRSSAIYGNSNTVQPPAIKVRVKTRYK